MPELVADCSAIAAIMFNEPGADEVAARLGDADLVAPTLLEFELANTCLKKRRREPALAAQFLAAFSARAALGISLRDIDADAALHLAERYKLSAYDAAYLWLARNLRVPLVTLDSRLAQAAALP